MDTDLFKLNIEARLFTVVNPHDSPCLVMYIAKCARNDQFLIQEYSKLKGKSDGCTDDEKKRNGIEHPRPGTPT